MVHQLVSEMPLLLPIASRSSSSKRNDSIKKSLQEIRPECEDGNSLADFLNLLSPGNV